MAIIVRMPQLAAGGDNASIQSWLVAKGDTVAQGDPIAEIETEKAVVEYEAETAGVLAGTLAEAGDTVEVGEPIAVIAESGESVEDALGSANATSEPADQPAAETAPSASGPVQEESVTPSTLDVPATSKESESPSAASDRVFASPLARKLAKENDVHVSLLNGTGPNGRIVRRDVEDFLAAKPQQDASPTPASASTTVHTANVAGPAPENVKYEDIPHSGMRRAIARRLTESKTTVPHFYVNADIRVDAMFAMRKQINAKLEAKVSVNDLVVKAVGVALAKVPGANAIWTEEATRKFKSVDIAVAVSVPNGLLTPVVRGVETKSITKLSEEIRELAARAREGKIKQHELEGGSFSVSNLGMYGTKSFSAILNPPQAGILAVGAAAKQPIVSDDGEIETAMVMSVTLSADHRVLDGALAAEWLAEFERIVENPMEILL
ncbi:MAG: pyruvate dehydrogenase complex dihydrolipoamide acetyltransferase [Gulosibacter sp.]|uniref:pyruvate dehydrogenase complex dihydrolipoamide acetyltransferase n=1 Tax=Gulosibacter sp. TaxID=2817531 RepID=UPI003F922849